MCNLPKTEDLRYLNRNVPNSDAGVFKLDEKTALVQSVDFFTPVVDDPYLFGAIAAANSLSDIYALGATPLTALNIVCFPYGKMGPEMLEAILKGGHDKVAEAGAVTVGGHSVEDDEPKFGLAVTGVVNPLNMISASGAEAGDVLVLTKPLGTGVIATALKGGVVSIDEVKETINGMATLNNIPSMLMKEYGVTSCTDITGFGLLGHGVELAEASFVSLEIYLEKLPVYPLALDFASEGFVPGGSYRNLDYFRSKTVFHFFGEEEKAKESLVSILADPQTSGGLLMTIPHARCHALLLKLEESGVKGYQVGRVVPFNGKLVNVI